MLSHHSIRLSGRLHGRPSSQQAPRQCTCRAKRGRPRKTDTQENADFDEFQQPVTTDFEPVSSRGRRRKTDVQAEEPLATVAAPLPGGQHDYIESLEMLQSAELDYNEDPNLADTAPPYTHAFQGPDSNELPPLMGGYGGSGFVGEEGFEAEQQRQEPGVVPAAAGANGALIQQQQLMQALPSAAALSDEEEDDRYRNQDIPPGVFDYEAGLPYAETIRDPEQLQEYFPPQYRPQSRKEAEYMLNWLQWVACDHRDRKTFEYEDMARQYMCMQNKETVNIYSNAKAMSIVTAEIEIEDHETGNRWDIYYPIWARAEHRWYPSGRFHAYNEYVKENIADLTVKYAPGHEQEADFDLLDDAFLLADDPSMAAGGANEERALGPAEGLGLDSFIEGVLPGAASSELGASYLEDVLAPTQEEELQEEDLE